MRGCCCCSSKATELSAAPTYYYVYPRTSEEHVPLSSHQGASTLSTGFLVDTNLDTSIPDTYRPPPAPIPYYVSARRPQTPPAARDGSARKSDATLQTTTSEPVQQVAGDSPREVSIRWEDLKGSDCKTDTKFEVDEVKKGDGDVELSKPVETVALVIEECPTCLEEYDEENPKVTTKCEHHFHLVCILEWMERSDTCPVCDKEMIIDPEVKSSGFFLK